MGMLLLEALCVLLGFVFIIWWTMFSGRKGGELPQQADADAPQRAASNSSAPPPPL